MPVVSYRVGFLSGLLAPSATLWSLLEAGGSTLHYAERPATTDYLEENVKGDNLI